jgi:hypothetical protein
LEWFCNNLELIPFCFEKGEASQIFFDYLKKIFVVAAIFGEHCGHHAALKNYQQSGN